MDKKPKPMKFNNKKKKTLLKDLKFSVIADDVAS